MPFLAVAAAGSQVAKLAGVSFVTPSEKRADKVIPSVVAAANKGNMAAVAILDTRRSIGIAAERAEWSKGYAQISGAVLQAYAPMRARYIDAIPATAQAGPEAAASYALQASFGLPALDQALAPINTALANNEAAFREGVAQSAERVGVGGGAALAQAARGTAGNLDALIAFTQKPAGMLTAILVGITVVATVAYAAGGRR